MHEDTAPEFDRFAQTVERLSLMSAELARAICEEATDSGLTPTEVAVRKSLLDEIEADIIDTLLHPLECAPGFEILDFVAKGGMGAVFRARQMSLDRIVAIKTILASSMHDKKSAARFEQEARTVAKLRHPNIVDALDFGQHRERWYFAMEYIDGNSAQSILAKDRQLDEAVCWSIIRQAAAGLQHAFRNGVMHHDIKPGNLMLVNPPDGYRLPPGVPMVKIADFGLSYLNQLWEVERSKSRQFSPAGSPPYMAPELFRGGRPDHLSDIYSLGVTALHLMTGKRVFFGSSREEILAEKNQPDSIVTVERFPELSHLSRAALASMISADPQGRPQSHDEVIQLAMELGRRDGDEYDLVVEPNPVSGEVDVGSPLLPVGILPGARSDDVATVLLPGDSKSNLRSRKENLSTGRIASSWYRLLIVPVILLVIAGVSIGIRQFQDQPYADRATNVVETESLFDGTTLSGFSIDQSMIGAWHGVTAPDSSPAFTCQNAQGAVTRSLPAWENYRLSLFVLQGSRNTFTDIAFDFGEDGMSSTVRLENGQVAVGEKSGDFGDFRPGNLPVIDASLQDRFHVLNIERQKDGWLLFFEEAFIGTIPVRSNDQDESDVTRRQNKIRICVEHDKVVNRSDNTYFTELFVERLQLAPVVQ